MPLQRPLELFTLVVAIDEEFALEQGLEGVQVLRGRSRICRLQQSPGQLIQHGASAHRG
jgi:hypothetical protein